MRIIGRLNPQKGAVKDRVKFRYIGKGNGYNDTFVNVDAISEIYCFLDDAGFWDLRLCNGDCLRISQDYSMKAVKALIHDNPGFVYTGEDSMMPGNCTSEYRFRSFSNPSFSASESVLYFHPSLYNSITFHTFDGEEKNLPRKSFSKLMGLDLENVPGLYKLRRLEADLGRLEDFVLKPLSK